MQPADPFGVVATQGNAVVMDPTRLARHAAFVAEMNATVSAFAFERLQLGDAPWSLHTLRLAAATAPGQPADPA
jgi:hypothetical protein